MQGDLNTGYCVVAKKLIISGQSWNILESSSGSQRTNPSGLSG